MSGLKRSPAFPLVGAILLALLLALVLSCSEEPTALNEENDQGNLSGTGTINPDIGGSFFLGSVSDTVVARGYIEVWGMNVAFDSANGIVSFDVQLLNRAQRNIAPPIHFVITDIRPSDIALLGFDGTTTDGFPFFDFSSKLGADNILTPGERSEPVTLKFHTVTRRSFAIGFRIDLGPPCGPGIIAGVVFRDDNQDGVRDTCAACEPGIRGITVALEKPAENGGSVTLITRTDLNGAYGFGGLREVFVVASPDCWKITSTNPLLITLIKGTDGMVQNFLEADFGLYPLKLPVPEILFGPIRLGWRSPYGMSLDSTFVNPPSPLTVVFKYYLEVVEPEFAIGRPWPGVVDSASAWINDELVFTYHSPTPWDTVPSDTVWHPYRFARQIIQLPDGLVKFGDNAICLFMDGDEYAILEWRVYRKP